MARNHRIQAERGKGLTEEQRNNLRLSARYLEMANEIERRRSPRGAGLLPK
jgi:hypothetical protein